MFLLTEVYIVSYYGIMFQIMGLPKERIAGVFQKSRGIGNHGKRRCCTAILPALSLVCCFPLKYSFDE
jgi:hypothetical protein